MGSPWKDYCVRLRTVCKHTEVAAKLPVQKSAYHDTLLTGLQEAAHSGAACRVYKQPAQVK